MRPRNAGADLGLGYRHRFAWGTLRATALQDVSNTSNGSEFQARILVHMAQRPLDAASGPPVSIRDSDLNNYYSGVEPREATADRPAYAPGGGVDYTVGCTAPIAS